MDRLSSLEMNEGHYDNEANIAALRADGDSVLPTDTYEKTPSGVLYNLREGNTSFEEKDSQDDDCAGTDDDLLSHLEALEARATVKFDKRTFIKELMYHNFFPLSIPFLYWLDGGKVAMINRGYMGKDHLYLIFLQWFLAVNFYVLNVVSLIFVFKAKKLDFLYDVLLVDLLWCMRNMVVATKYAFLSKPEKKKMQTVTLHKDVLHYRTLLSAWKDPIPCVVLKTELLLAAIRTKTALRDHYFSLDMSAESTKAIHDLIFDLTFLKEDAKRIFPLEKQAERWLAAGVEVFTREPMAQLEAGRGESVELLPVRMYAAHVIYQSSSLIRLKRIGHTLLSQHTSACAWTVGLAHGIIPTLGRYLIGGHEIPGPSWAHYCVLVPSFVMTVFAMGSNAGFMMIGVLDFRRRHFIAQSLDDLLRTSTYTGSHDANAPSLRREHFRKIRSWLRFRGNDSQDRSLVSRSSSSGKLAGDGIFFDFQDPNSLLAWWACRQLMQNFGLGFYKRIKYYTTFFAGYCGVLLFFVVLKMLTGIHRDDIYLLISVIFSINAFLTLLALMVWPGGDVNHMQHHHGVTILRRKVHTHVTTIPGCNQLLPPVDLKKAKLVLRTITSISEALKWDNMKWKLSICGFEARDQLVSVIIAAVAASMSLGIGQIVQNGVVF